MCYNVDEVKSNKVLLAKMRKKRSYGLFTWSNSMIIVLVCSMATIKATTTTTMASSNEEDDDMDDVGIYVDLKVNADLLNRLLGNQLKLDTN